MTVQDAVEMWSKNNGAFTKEGKTRKFKATVGYSVIADTSDEMIDVLAAPKLPRINDRYSSTASVFCTGLTPNQVSPVYWIVTASYEGEVGESSIKDDPINRPPIISWGHAEEDVGVDEDINGKAIATAAGERFHGVTKKVHDIVLNVKRNYKTIDLPATHAYLHSVNGDTFAGFAPGLGRMVRFNADEKFDQTYGGYFEVSASIQFRFPYRTTPDKAWYARLLHEGYYYKTAPDKDPIRAMTAGQPSVQPVLLSANGGLLPAGQTPVWLEFEIYQKLPYGALGLV